MRDPRTSDRAMVSLLKKRALLIGMHCASEATQADVANIIRHLGRKGEMHPAAWEKLLEMVRKKRVHGLEKECLEEGMGH